MIDTLEKKQLLTVEEYFKLEETAIQKHEFRNGKLVPMPGGSISHNRIKGNIYFLLRIFVKQIKQRIEILDSDQKIHIEDYNSNVYSDTCVIIGNPKLFGNGKQAITNPTLVIEVLSNSTARYDRGRKFLKYKSLPSFTEYVLIEQDVPMVDVITQKEGNWIIKSYIGLQDVVILESIGCEIKMEDIYENVEDLENPQGIFDFEEKAK